MTDKWDMISTRLMNEDWPEHLSMRDAVKWSIKRGSDALREAYAEGEKAGMERAALMATEQANVFRNEAHDQKQWGNREMHKLALMIASFFDSHATAIRAAKETKE